MGEHPVCLGYAAASFLGPLDEGNLVEVSGLAVSQQNPGLIWMHNDSGHSAVLYGVNEQRQIVRELILDGLEQTDWEDIALGPCGDTECVFLGDIGDNEQTRDTVRLVMFEEPHVDVEAGYGKELFQDYSVYRFEYPDQPKDAEALAVHPDGQIYLFTKEGQKTGLFRFPPLETATIRRLEPLGERAMTEKVTAADVHRGGGRLLLRTAGSLLELELEQGAPLESALNATATIVDTGGDQQSEAAGYDPRTGHIFHAAEKGADASRLYELRCDQGE